MLKHRMPRRRPDVKGDAAFAWEVPLERCAAWAATHPDHVDPRGLMATVCMFYVNGTGFHPFWKWWLVSVIDLRSVRELGETPQVDYPAAEFELLVVTLDPAQGSPPVNGDGPWHIAPGIPVEEAVPLRIHFHGLERDQAHDVARFFVEAVCAGVAIPSDDRRLENRERMTRLIKDYYVGKYGGRFRLRYPDVEPETGIFNGEEEAETWVAQ